MPHEIRAATTLKSIHSLGIPVTPDDQCQACERHERERCTIGMQPHPRDDIGAGPSKRTNTCVPEDHQAKTENA